MERARVEIVAASTATPSCASALLSLKLGLLEQHVAVPRVLLLSGCSETRVLLIHGCVV